MDELPPRMPPMATVQDFLLAAASELLRAVDAAHDKEPPLKYTIPYGAVNVLRKAVAEVEAAPKTVPVREPSITLNGYQLKAALEFVAPDGDADQLETDIVIQHGREGHSGPGYYCFLLEYPDEGAVLLPDSSLNGSERQP